MSEYPKALYREGPGMIWGGKALDMEIVEDRENEDAARADGWMTADEVHAEPSEETPRRGRPPKIAG